MKAVEMALSDAVGTALNHQHLTSFVYRHECCISIAFVIRYAGSSYRREPGCPEAPEGLPKLRARLQVWKLLK